MFAAVVSQVDSDGPPPGDGRETDETGTNPNEGDETSGSFGCHPARISERICYGLLDLIILSISLKMALV